MSERSKGGSGSILFFSSLFPPGLVSSVYCEQRIHPVIHPIIWTHSRSDDRRDHRVGLEFVPFLFGKGKLSVSLVG